MSGGIGERSRNIASGINIERDRDDIRSSALEALQNGSEATHARDDALSPREFEQLVESSYQVDNDRIELECRTLLFLAGRVGLRKGEITHLSPEWMNWTEGTIEIPESDPCTKGQHDAEPCGYCRRRAEDRVETKNITLDEAADAVRHVLDEPETVPDAQITEEARDLREEVNISLEDALAQQWQPKTATSAREVTFDFDVRVELALEEFFERFDGWERSAATVNRRINRVAELSAVESRVYPHALRATAASYHASRDISIHALMSTMGWADPGTARAYVTSNADQAAREIRSKHR